MVHLLRCLGGPFISTLQASFSSTPAPSSAINGYTSEGAFHISTRLSTRNVFISFAQSLVLVPSVEFAKSLGISSVESINIVSKHACKHVPLP